MKAYEQTPEAKARRKAHMKAYNQTPEAKARHKAYEQTPEAKARKRANAIKKLMNEYQINEEEAGIVRSIRMDLSFQSPQQIGKMLYELQQEEGLNFAEMIMDGIPKRKGVASHNPPSKEGGI